MWEGRAGFEITCMSRGPLGLRAGTSGCREVSLELWGEVPAGGGFGSCGLLGGEGSRTGVVDRGGRYSSWGLQQGRPTQILPGCGGLDTGGKDARSVDVLHLQLLKVPFSLRRPTVTAHYWWVTQDENEGSVRVSQPAGLWEPRGCPGTALVKGVE